MSSLETFENLDRFLDVRLKTWTNKAKSRKAPYPGGPVVTLSREPGCNIKSVALLLSDKMGLDIYGRKIVEQIAEVTHTSEEVVSTLDEKSRSELEEWIATTQDLHGLSAFNYLKGLKKVVFSIATHGNAIILGRGGNFLVPPEKRVALRLVAPFEMRFKDIMGAMKLSQKSAREYIAKAEHEQRLFIKRYFNAEIADPAHYDTVINMESVAPEAVPGIVKAILNA